MKLLATKVYCFGPVYLTKTIVWERAVEAVTLRVTLSFRVDVKRVKEGRPLWDSMLIQSLLLV